MATLIIADNPGRWRRRCDANCHIATEPRCDCVCGGRYHGKGRTPGALEEEVRRTQDDYLLHGLDNFARPGEQVNFGPLVALRDALQQGILPFAP